MWAPKHALGAKVEMALGVARGMAALEGARPPLLHRDLKPTNVFIGARRRFGVGLRPGSGFGRRIRVRLNPAVAACPEPSQPHGTVTLLPARRGQPAWAPSTRR